MTKRNQPIAHPLLALAAALATWPGCAVSRDDLNKSGGLAAVIAVGAGLAVGAGAVALAAQPPPVSVPGYGTRMTDSPYAPRDVAQLLTRFERSWGARVAPDVDGHLHAALNRLNVTWIPGAFATQRGLAMGAFDGAGSDQVIFRGHVRVAWTAGRVLNHTALSHELCHLALEAQTGQSGEDHLASQGWTSAVEAVINDLRMAQIQAPFSGP